MTVGAPSYKGFRFPAEIISHCVWLYHRFPLSFREVQEMMLARGVTLSHESGSGVRSSGKPTPTGCAGAGLVRGIGGTWTRCSSRSTVSVTTCGGRWTTTGPCWTPLVTSRRDARAATRFFCKLLKDLEYAPRVLVTDKLASYGVAHHRLMPGVEHRRSKYLNNRAENSHQPTRHRERAMKRFTSARHAQRFLSAFSGISPHFRPRRHRLTAEEYQRAMDTRFTTWNQVTGTTMAAA